MSAWRALETEEGNEGVYRAAAGDLGMEGTWWVGATHAILRFLIK